eukprot:5805516-Prymnesium_polylepis.1
MAATGWEDGQVRAGRERSRCKRACSHMLEEKYVGLHARGQAFGPHWRMVRYEVDDGHGDVARSKSRAARRVACSFVKRSHLKGVRPTSA